MVYKYQDNLTIHIQMLISEASNVIKHSTLGLSLNIVLIDIRIIKTDFISSNTIGAVDSNSILYVFGEWARNHLDNYDIAILFTTTSFGQDSGASSMRYTFPSWIVVEDSGVFTISTIAHEIGHALGVNHEFDDDICNKKISINKVHFLMSYNTKPPFIWSNCSRTGITYFLNQQLTFFKKPEKFIDLSKVPLMGQFYSADKHCEIKFGTGFTLNRTSNYPIEECRELICSDGISVEKSLSGMFDFTPCGIEKICYNNDCIKQTQLKRINGGWSEWIPTGSCSGSCDIGIRKSIRKCNNPQPEYGGNYCFGKKLRFETCNLKPCSETTIDFRQQQCSKFNNNSTNFTAFYDPQDNEQLCKLTCQEISEKNSSIILENIMDGTFCGSNSHKFDYMCNNGECKKIGCTKNDNVFDPNSILDICNVSRGYNSNKEVLIQDSRSQILSQLLYEPPENWTLDNCCIIIYRMKKNWQMIIDYWNEEKLNLLGISELLYNNSIISWDEFYKINHHDVTWSHLKGLQNKTTENFP